MCLGREDQAKAPAGSARGFVKLTKDYTELHDIGLAQDLGGVLGGEAAVPQGFGGDGVAGNDAVELVLGGAEMIANDFAEHGTIIARAFQVTTARLEHRSGGTGDPGD